MLVQPRRAHAQQVHVALRAVQAHANTKNARCSQHVRSSHPDVVHVHEIRRVAAVLPPRNFSPVASAKDMVTVYVLPLHAGALL